MEPLDLNVFCGVCFNLHFLNYGTFILFTKWVSIGFPDTDGDFFTRLRWGFDGAGTGMGVDIGGRGRGRIL